MSLSPVAQFVILCISVILWFATPDIDIPFNAFGYRSIFCYEFAQLFSHFWPIVLVYFSIRMFFSKEWKSANRGVFVANFLIGFVPLACVLWAVK